MNNYQLYRTNVLLGGQMKWDLILDSTDSNLIVKDFHLTPICNSVPYNKYVQESLLNYSHQENIKNYYKKISGSFYENYIDKKLESSWPIISNTPIDTHVGEFEMGCRRATYNIYKKQFEFLCPLWLEYLNDDLVFELSAVTQSGHKILQKKLKLDISGISTYHDKFVNYFKEYIKYLNINLGNDDIMSIQLDKRTAQIKGLNVKTGLLNNLDISFITDTLIDRERPLLEFDNIIINQIKDHNLIVPQLFNFNFCFNPEDVLPAPIINMLKGKPISFKVSVFIGDEKLELRDFYSNYEYIPRKLVGPVIEDKNYNAPNVLEYLQDYNYVELIDKNKIVQNTIHWSLADNNDYIFNVYEGFKGFSIDENGNIINYAHLYDNSPNINVSEYKKSLNSLGWCNYIEVGNKVTDISIVEFLTNIDSYLKYTSNFSSNEVWINKIKYDVNKHHEFDLNVLLIENKTEQLIDINNFYLEDDIKQINIKITKLNNDIQVSKYDHEYLSDNVLQFLIYKNNLLIIYNSKYAELLTFINTYNILKAVVNNKIFSEHAELITLTNNLLSKMAMADHSNNPPLLRLKKSLIISRESGPSLSSKEITYYKDDNSGEYVLRYFGKIKPTFLKETNDINFNYLYYLDVLTDDRSNGLSEYQKSPYSLYMDSGFLPKYPSLKYFPIKKVQMDYNIPPKNYKGENILNNMEWHWFNNNYHIILSNEILFELYTTANSNMNELIMNYLKKYYNLSDEIIEYIFDLYLINIDFDYRDKQDIQNYKYNIKLILK